MNYREGMDEKRRPEGWAEHEWGFWRRAGVDPRLFIPPPPTSDHPVVRTARELKALVTDSWTITEAARRLGVPRSRLRRSIELGRLYAIQSGRRWRVPRFLFDDAGTRLVPGVEALTSSWKNAHPLEVLVWFTEPHVDLEDERGDRVSPRQWLLAGNDPTFVVTLATEFEDPL